MPARKTNLLIQGLNTVDFLLKSETDKKTLRSVAQNRKQLRKLSVATRNIREASVGGKALRRS